MLHLEGYKVAISPDELRERAFAEFETTLGDIQDQSHYVVQAHLFLEQMLARIIGALLPRGHEMLQGAQWSFHHKLLLVNALDVLSPDTFEGLRTLNSLRNRIAHRLRYEVTTADVQGLASALDKPVMEELAKEQPMMALQSLAISLLGDVGTTTVAYENLQLESSAGNSDA